MKLFLAACLLTAFQGVARADEAADRASIQRLVTQLKTAAAADLRCRHVADCTAIAAGSRACGGPSMYVVTSTSNPKLRQVEALARKVTDAQVRYNQTYGGASICSFEMPPEMSCINKLCR